MAEVAKLRAMKSKQKQEEKMKVDKPKYCLCESTDDQRFMIMCDECQMWYHCDCMEITRTMAKKIEHYYCPKCISKDGNLTIVYKSKSDAKKKETLVKERPIPKEKEPPKSIFDLSAFPTGYDYESNRCNHCVGCLRPSNCLKCENCHANRSPCFRRICIRGTAARPTENEQEQDSSEDSEVYLSDKDDEAYVLPPSATGKQIVGQTKATPAKRGRKKGWRKADAVPKPPKVPGKRGRPCKNAVSAPVECKPVFAQPQVVQFVDQLSEPVEECWGPRCGELRRPQSKYCSDECGIALAGVRLKKFLPGILDDYWRNPPRNFVEAEKRVKEIDEEGDRLKLRIKVLTEYAEMLDEWNRVVMQMAVDEEYVAPSTGDDFTVHCQICSADVNVKGFTKHVERCFIRVEKTMSFGSAVQYPQNPHNVFCEEYNKTNNTYCKRLRIGCPEHYKPSKDDEDVVCGCPQIWYSVSALTLNDLFVNREKLLSGGYCKNNRKQCDAHRRWDQYVAGQIDVERARSLYRADELIEQRRVVMVEQNHRGCVVELMTNFTRKEGSEDFESLSNGEMKYVLKTEPEEISFEEIDEKPEQTPSKFEEPRKSPILQAPKQSQLQSKAQTQIHSQKQSNGIQKSDSKGSKRRKGSPGIKTYTQGADYNEDEVYFVGTLNNDDS